MWLPYPQWEIGKVFIVVVSESTALQVTRLVFKVLLPREDRLSLLISALLRGSFRKEERTGWQKCRVTLSATECGPALLLPGYVPFNLF